MNPKPFRNKRVLVIGGTGSLGKNLVRRLLTGDAGMPDKIIVLSRDEWKHWDMRNANARTVAADGRKFSDVVEFRIGDIRDYRAICRAVRDAHIVVQAAALKHVPVCEYAPGEAVATNVNGAQNVVDAIRSTPNDVELAIAVSTDKACKPVNVMGMAKALMERTFIEGNIGQSRCRFVCVRYGNVVASRGSVVPFFLEQIANGGPVTITVPEMTRFLITFDGAVDTVYAAASMGRPGDTFVPRLPSTTVERLAKVLIGWYGKGRNIDTVVTGIRPGEKIHEIMVSEDEVYRTEHVDHVETRRQFYAVRSMLAELGANRPFRPAINGEYSSMTEVVSDDDTLKILRDAGYCAE